MNPATCVATLLTASPSTELGWIGTTTTSPTVFVQEQCHQSCRAPPSSIPVMSMASERERCPAAQFHSALIKEIRAARNARGWTQGQLAARTGGVVSKGAVASYETGHRTLRVSVVWVLARALEVDLAVLIRRAELALNANHIRDTGSASQGAGHLREETPALDVPLPT